MRRRVQLVLTLVALLLVGAVGRADAVVYWTSGDTVGLANLDGSELVPWLPEQRPLPEWRPVLDAGNPCGLAVDAGHIYWADSWAGTIGRASIDGTAANEVFITGLSQPCGVAVDASYVYWADAGTNMIGRARLDGTEVSRGFIAGGSSPCGVAVDGSHLYWGNGSGDAIGRAELDGDGVDQQFVVGANHPCGVAVGGGHVYWASNSGSGSGSIGRAGLDGTAVDNFFVPDAGEPRAVAANSTHVYWADEGWRNFKGGGNPYEILPGSIGRARLDGTEVNRRLIGVGLTSSVALDSVIRQVKTVLRPSDFLRFGKLTHNRDGSVGLVVVVPARGEFSVDGPRIGWRIDKGHPPPYLAGSFRWKLKLWPGKGTRAAKRIHRQLRRDGRAPVILQITYQQEGRSALEATKRFAFRR